MTKRLYYDDAYLREFESQVEERTVVNGRPAVVLNRSAFYPTSGGQPHDTGLLNDVPVMEVIEREEDKAVIHILAEKIEGETVQGVIDWDRRFDHM